MVIMSEEKKPYLIINKEHNEIQINIKHTKPYIDLQQENNQLKADLTKEKLAYSNLRDTYNKKYDECKLYKEVIEKANNELITLIQIIMEQPSKNVEEDNYLLSRLESISNILVGGKND